MSQSWMAMLRVESEFMFVENVFAFRSETGTKPNDVTDVRVLSTTEIAFAVLGVPGFVGNAFVPGGSLLDEPEEAEVVSRCCCNAAVGSHDINGVQVLRRFSRIHLSNGPRMHPQFRYGRF